MARAEPGDRFSPHDSDTECTRNAAADNLTIMLRITHLGRPCKQMAVFIILLSLITLSHSDEFVVNITDQVTSELPPTTFTHITSESFYNNTDSTPFPVEETTVLITPQVQTDEKEENVTSGARKGRLVNGNWDTRELALQFHGSPVFPAAGFQPMLPLPDTVVTVTEGVSIPVVMPQIQIQTPGPINEAVLEEQPSGNFEDRILNPFTQSMNNIFIKEAVRKGPDNAEMNAEMNTPSSIFMSGIPPPQQTQNQNQEPKFQLDSNQMAIAQAAIQAAQSLFNHVGQKNQVQTNNEHFPASTDQHTLAESSPWQQQQQQHHQTFTEPSPWQQHDKFSNTASDPPPLLSLNPPSVPPPTIFRDVTENGNKRYGGPNEPFHKYHDLTYTYYAPPPPPPPHPYPPPHPPPPHYHHEKPYQPPHHGGTGGGKNILGDVTHLFTDLKRNVVGTAHRFGEKVANSIGDPHKWSSIVPAATTLLVGGLALKLLASKANSFGSYNNTNLPLFTLGKRRKRSDDGDMIDRFGSIPYVLVFERAAQVNGRPALVTKRRRRSLNEERKLVFDFSPVITQSRDHKIEKRSVNERRESLVFVRRDEDVKRRKRDTKKQDGGLDVENRKKNETLINSTGSVSVRSKLERSLDGTFTEDELNNLVNRLDPVQKQFLQKLQWYGFDRWKEMPCAKFILCDVIVHSDYQHIYDLERRIGLFLSLMDDDSARKVEVMIKDLILSIEARDCSQFFCPQESMHHQLSQMPPIHPLPPPPPFHHPTWTNHLPPSYRHPYAFPKSSSEST